VRSVASVWVCTGRLAFVGVHFGPLAVPAAFKLTSPMHARFAILMHEAAHKLHFSSRRTHALAPRCRDLVVRDSRTSVEGSWANFVAPYRKSSRERGVTLA
jgi:hypothetical protein